MMEGDNSNQPAFHALWSGPDPHGHAAMLLVESILHGLVARSIISLGDAIEMVDTACDVKAEIGPEVGDTAEALQKSLRILAAVGVSLRCDLSDR